MSVYWDYLPFAQCFNGTIISFINFFKNIPVRNRDSREDCCIVPIFPHQVRRRPNYNSPSNALLNCLSPRSANYKPPSEHGHSEPKIHLQSRIMLIKIPTQVLFKIPSSQVVLLWEKKYENFGRQ